MKKIAKLLSISILLILLFTSTTLSVSGSPAVPVTPPNGPIPQSPTPTQGHAGGFSTTVRPGASGSFSVSANFNFNCGNGWTVDSCYYTQSYNNGFPNIWFTGGSGNTASGGYHASVDANTGTCYTASATFTLHIQYKYYVGNQWVYSGYKTCSQIVGACVTVDENSPGTPVNNPTPTGPNIQSHLIKEIDDLIMNI
jgi:hypothetical protein